MYNFSNSTAKLLYNFMKNRSFQAMVHDVKSEVKFINKGSPQGSSVLAFAFLLYTADFSEPQGEKMKSLRYADDVAIVVSDENIYRAERNINQYLRTVTHYTKKFRLKLNKTKYELLIVLGRWKDIGATLRKKF